MSTFARSRPLGILALCSLSLAAQQTAEKTMPVFTDGMAQVVDAFADRGEWIHDRLWVETDFDSDGDGAHDRVFVNVTRQKQTDTEGLKVPVVYETSPYFAGIGSTDSSYFWDPHQELGDKPNTRKAMPPIRFAADRERIDPRDGFARYWLPRGFAVVQSDSPGTGLSQGCPTIGGSNEAFAPKAVIDWLNGRAKGFTTIDGNEEIEAKWCTGKVGMVGTSYNGTLPIAAATTGVEGLEAIIPIAPNTSYYHYYRSNGLVRHPGGYMGEDVDVLYDFINSGDPKKRDWCNQHVRDELLAGHADRMSGDLNDFWAGRDYANQLSKFHAAALMVHGFNDWNVMPEHTVRIYEILKKNGVTCMAWFHQGPHADPLPSELKNRWFTRFLYGIENGVETGPHAFVMREDQPLRGGETTPYPDYPNPGASPVKVFPTAGGPKTGGLALQPVADSVSETLIDDAAQKGADLAGAEASEHRLLYTTPELQHDLHLSGTATLEIRLAASKPAVNLSVWLVSLPWERSRRVTDNIITRGWADPQNARSLRESTPLTPGEFVTLRFGLQPDDQVVRQGQRVGLMIFASDHDFTLWPPAGTELTVDLQGTSLELPVVGGRAAFEKAIGQ
ncbi:MAG: Xaa-Pro dipeptidyl-peptidase [Planctomycetes bacterium]|nr:Xaa-Pro dipeptidyl-peptidase [Planctomycetota bacterium]